MKKSYLFIVTLLLLAFGIGLFFFLQQKQPNNRKITAVGETVTISLTPATNTVSGEFDVMVTLATNENDISAADVLLTTSDVGVVKIVRFTPSSTFSNANIDILLNTVSTIGNNVHFIAVHTGGIPLTSASQIILGTLTLQTLSAGTASIALSDNTVTAATLGGRQVPATLTSNTYTVPTTTSAPLTWTTGLPMPTGRSNFAAAVVAGKIYAIGGITASGPTALVEEYDPTTNLWTSKTALSARRSNLTAAVVAGKIYAIGGSGSTGAGALVEEFDPAANNGAGSWTRKADMPTGRSSFATAVVAGKIYAIGGRGAGTSVEEFDPNANTWRSKNAMPTSRSDFAAAVVAGKIYAIGGFAGVHLTSVEEFDPNANSWTSKNALPTGRSHFATAVFDNKIYAIGGSGSTGTIVEEFDPNANSWASKTPLPTGRTDPSAAVVAGKIYVIGGSGSSILNTVDVASIAEAPTVTTFTIGPTTFPVNSTVTFTWTTTNTPAECHIEGWDGGNFIIPTGSENGAGITLTNNNGTNTQLVPFPIAGNHRYRISCSNAAGANVSNPVDVSVGSAATSTPAPTLTPTTTTAPTTPPVSPTAGPSPTCTPLPEICINATPHCDPPAGGWCALTLSPTLPPVSPTNPTATLLAVTISLPFEKAATKLAVLQVTNTQNTDIASVSTSLQRVQGTTTDQYVGIFNLGRTIPEGNYRAKIKSDKYLRKLIGRDTNQDVLNLRPEQNSPLPATTLKIGDINDDNKIDLLDYNILIDCGVFAANPQPISSTSAIFGTQACQAHPKRANADLNDDGIVDLTDRNVFLRSIQLIEGD